MNNKTYSQDFKYFCKQCNKYIDELSLRDWRYYFHHENHPDSYAWVKPDAEAKQAQVGLSPDWGETKVTKEMLNYCAKHEILHVLLADLANVGKLRQSTDQDFSMAQHAIIRRLENAWS